MQAYQTCIQSVQLYGPTNISPIINHVAHFAHEATQMATASVSEKMHLDKVQLYCDDKSNGML